MHHRISYEEDTISLSDILLTMAEQLKVIVLTTFSFPSFSPLLMSKFIQAAPVCQLGHSTCCLLNSGGNLGGLAGLASQFGVNVPTGCDRQISQVRPLYSMNYYVAVPLQKKL